MHDDRRVFMLRISCAKAKREKETRINETNTKHMKTVEARKENKEFSAQKIKKYKIKREKEKLNKKISKCVLNATTIGQ